jgi:PPOX class probable FMN-dependent enzyme
MYQPTDVIANESEVRAILGEVLSTQVNKVIDHIDRHCRTWIERSPFVAMTTMDRSGRLDVSPKGDPPGFVKVVDEKSLAIPDRPGNRRADGFLNILETSRIGLMFVVPKRREVLRVNGSAQIVRDPGLLETMAVNDRVPVIATLVRVEEAFFHCGKAMIRSGMWEPESWGDIEGLSTYAEAVMDHARPSRSLSELERIFARNETDRLY